MEVAGVEIVSAITRGSAEALQLQPGDRVKAIIKATEVIVDKDLLNRRRTRAPRRRRA